MQKISVKSVAKINLGLNVIRKRTDGFHDIETIFYPLLLSDVIEIEKSNHFSLTYDSEELKSVNENLVTRAVKILERDSNKVFKVDIKLEKRIPVGGGLGGGSSNAASTLKLINQMFDLGYDYNQLCRFALEIGSDVPYFLNPIPCFAEKRGEQISPIPLSINYPILLINPGITISTKWAFSKITSKMPKISLRNIFSSGQFNFEQIKESVTNDFEEAVFREYPLIKKLKDELYSFGASFALMTGTGSSLFGIYDNLQTAKSASEYFSQKYFTYLNIPFIEGSIT